ncbi:MAG: hypothetical protein RLZZ464_373 [Pseudomonadota bacterium]|jgi:hypothetical protein
MPAFTELLRDETELSVRWLPVDPADRREEYMDAVEQVSVQCTKTLLTQILGELVRSDTDI